MSKLRHNIGDIIKIKSKEWYEHNKQEDNCVCDANSPIPFTHQMIKYLGCEFKIGDIKYDEEYDRNVYLLVGAPYHWDDYMFEEQVNDLIGYVFDDYQLGYITFEDTIKKIKCIILDDINDSKKNITAEKKNISINEYVDIHFDDIISNFDVESAYKHMKSLDWNYWNHERCISEPVTVDSIKKVIKNLIISSLKKLQKVCAINNGPYSCETGGFRVTSFINDDNEVIIDIEYIPFETSECLPDMDVKTLINLENK